MEFPLIWDLDGIALSSNILPNMKWEPSRGTKITVIDLNEDKVVKTYTVDAFFGYHHVNAYEEDNGDIIVDIMTAPCDNSKGEA